ncbi:suppressor protein SRP40-like isoform X1 [Populus alba x Populus x berolinensis]|uniref:Suppressor protein SRP40-like isoform X1 n=1 Tax=Populus alba x Populus x berolinensis TaxID=444605 RepID=A0AAD6LD73_9ROSI|nr:suppressor protein SRP40-like isoform X1 [Populus alba x Populus x berolinensis]
MKQENNKDNSKTQTLKPEQKALLLHSIAKYLENIGGFSKTLKKFESEAKFEKDDLGGDSLIDLEEVFCKFLKTSDNTSKKLESNQVQDIQTNGVTKKKGKCDTDAIKNQLGAGDNVNDSESVEEIITNDKVATEVRSKEKKGKKRNSDSHGQEEQDNVKALKEPADNGAGELPDKKRRDKKKKKSNSESESQDDNNGHHLAEPMSMEEKSKDVASSKGNKVTGGETDNKPKDKKRKKDKLFDSAIGNGEQHISESKQGASADSIMDNKNIKSEGKKERKDAVFSENLSAEMLDEGKSNSEKDDSKNLKEDVNVKDNKSSKKRKRMSSEDDATQTADEKAIEESKRRKTESSEELKENFQANGNLEENGAKSAPQKSMMKEKNGSVEPKMVKHFQRVKVDEVVFSDERLKDNSYWAKDGAEDGYGAKAQEVLGQVRGRGFRHEKTKKKRGTYRGGQIDLQSHSFKFNYSDED